jgi:hypothetical protein
VSVTRVTGDTRVQPHTANLITSPGSCANSSNHILLSPHASSSGLTVCEAGSRHEFGAIAVVGGEDRRVCVTGNPEDSILPSSNPRSFVLVLVFDPQSYHSQHI